MKPVSGKKRRALSHIVVVVAGVLIALTFFLALNLSCANKEVWAADSEETNMSAGFNPSFQLPAGMAFYAIDRPLLYEKNTSVQLEIPAVTHLMTLLISSDLIQDDELILISPQVAALARFEQSAHLELKKDMKLPYHYLALRMVMQNSDSATLAIAEHLAGNEVNFLKQMQQKASELGMSNTNFKTILVSKAERQHDSADFYSDPDIDWSNIVFSTKEQTGHDSSDPSDVEEDQLTVIPYINDQEIYTASTNLDDLSLLAQALRSSRNATDYLSVTEELLTLHLENGDQVIPMRSSINRLFTLSEGEITAAYQQTSSRFSLTFSFGRTAEGITLTTLLVSPHQSPLIDESLKLYENIDLYYQRTALTEEGADVPGINEKSESGESFSLQYLDTIYYVHPRDNFYLKDDIIYIGDAPYLLPIQKGSMTGQIIFELLDGSHIPVRVGPDRDIISSNTIMARLVTLLYNNSNLGKLILLTAVFLCIIIVILLLREIVLLTYWRRQSRLERSGRRDS